MKPTISLLKISNLKSFHSLFGRLDKKSVFVGIKDPENAQKLFIFSKGSPINKTPPRPLLEPSIEAHSAEISELMAQASIAELNGFDEESSRLMKQAGEVAASGAKDWFYDSRNGWARNAPRTIKNKGFDSPGIDSGDMRESIDSWLKEDES
jgi:hypothetical protein